MKKYAYARVSPRVRTLYAAATGKKAPQFNLFGRETGIVSGIKDISVRGAAVYVKHDLRPGTKVHLEIYEPSLTERLCIDGRVRWCEVLMDGALMAGLEFTDVDIKNYELLHSVVKHYQTLRT